MFNDKDNFGLFFGLAALAASYFMGKEHGEQKVIRQVEELALIAEQNQQIQKLQATIDEMKRNFNQGIVI